MTATLEPTTTPQAGKPATATAVDVIRKARDAGVQVVDLRFTDLPGTWQHFSIPLKELTEDLFKEGIGFDGSSIRGFQAINESDMLLFADPASAFVDPCLEVPTLSLTCDVSDPVTGARYSRDPRYVAQKAEQYLVKTGIATTAYYGPEAEFYIFNSVRFDQNAHEGYYHIDSEEGIWNSGTNGSPNMGHRPRHKEGYFPVPPVDRLQDLRSKIMLALIASGVDVEVHHHEVGTAGQTEIDMRFTTLGRMADQLMMYKYIVNNVCHQHGYTATFMPKPMFGDNGSGMHVHMSLWKDGTNLFFDPKGYALLSDAARWYIGGLIKHAPALLAFAAPTTNSYRRLVPGYEAPINLIYSQRNRSAICRIPVYSKSPKAKRIEFRAPDPSSNPYLTFAALLMAGLGATKRELLELCKKQEVNFLRLQFTDILGVNKNVEVPESQFEKALEGDIMFDGSSIEGFVRIEESDMVLKPDLETFRVLPYDDEGGRIARLICDIYNSDGSSFAGCTRQALPRQIAAAKALGFEMMAGAEAEFFIFQLDASGEPTTETHDHGGYFDQTPVDRAEEIRRLIIRDLVSMGFEVEAGHHEVAPGQHEIDFRYAAALETADNLATFRFMVRNVAYRHGFLATFMPKPIFGQNGSGMHTHQSLFKGAKNAFHDPAGKWELSATAIQYVAGLLKHARGI